MSEAGFRIFREVYRAGAELFYAVMLMLFFRPFMIRRKRDGRKLPVVFAAYLAVSLFTGAAVLPRGASGVLLAVLLTGMSGVLGLGRKKALWLTLLYWNARVCGGLMLESLYFLIEGLPPQGAGTPEKAYCRAAVLVLLFLFTHIAVLGLMLYILQRQIRKKSLYLCWRELCCISLIPAAGILFGQMISRLLFEFQDGVFLQLYERHPVFLVMVPLLALLFYAGTVLAIAAGQEMAVLQEKEAAGFVERQQMRTLRERLQETERSAGQIRRMKHEMRGHMMNIRGLAASGSYGELDAYIGRMDQEMGELELMLQTGNAVTDVIVNDKRRQCLEAGISFETDFHYPETGGYEAFDLGIILQNLLQNALEAGKKAAGEESFITLAGKQKGKFFLIEVKNNFAGEVEIGPEGMIATTKKEDVRMHGIGLFNVRRTAEKYMGELELKAEGQVFCATVLLQERSAYE